MCFMSYWSTSPSFLLGEAAAFDEEWRREAGRYAPPNARGLDYGRDRRAGGQQLALPAPPSSTPPPGHRHESPRHRQPHTRPRYDWWEGKRDIMGQVKLIIYVGLVYRICIYGWLVMRNYSTEMLNIDSADSDVFTLKPWRSTWINATLMHFKASEHCTITAILQVYWILHHVRLI